MQVSRVGRAKFLTRPLKGITVTNSCSHRRLTLHRVVSDACSWGPKMSNPLLMGRTLWPSVIVTLVMTVNLAQPGSPAAASGHAPATICSRSFDPYRVPVRVLQSCGDKILWLRRVTRLPGGGRAYSYGAYTRLVPPTHFNVLKASDKQLREYGLPTRKQLGHQWYGVMKHFGHVAPATRYLVEAPHVAAATCQLPNCSANWSGHYVTGHTYTEVTTTWTEPSFVSAGCSGDAFAQWAGMGGTEGPTVPTNLGQAGTLFNYPNFAAHQGFIETIINGSGPPVAANGFIPSADDSVYVSVLWSGSSGYYSYFMEDITTNTSYSAHSRTDGSPDNSTAEVMSERPTIGSGPSQLSKFQNLSVTDAKSYWSGGSAGFVNNPHHYGTTMQGPPPNSDTLATTTNLNSSSSFSSTWGNCS